MSRITQPIIWTWSVLARSQWRRKLLVAGPAIIGFTVLGPFATYLEIAPLPRLLYWTLELLGIGFFMHLVIWPLLNLPAIVSWPRPLVVLVGSAIAAVPGTAIIYMLEAAFRGLSLQSVGTIGLWSMVTLVGWMIASVEFAPEIFGSNRLLPDTSPTTLPPPLQGSLISLSHQDHYVEVTSTSGSELVRMRFLDALGALTDQPGARIHRSHWVARPALVSVERSGHRYVASLVDGRTLPISRPYLRAARNLLLPEQQYVGASKAS